MITVACVLRAGGKVGYDASWVEILQNSVKRNLTIPHRFVCLSDVDVSCERISLDTQGSGWWAKIQLFKPGLFSGPILYFDLDTVICGNLDPIVETAIKHNKFLMEYDIGFKLSSSAIMFWNGDYSKIYNKYMTDPMHYEDIYSIANQGPQRQVGDQALIASMVDHDYINHICPSNWFHIITKQDHRADLSQVKILIFRKAKQKPTTMTDHPLVQRHWK